MKNGMMDAGIVEVLSHVPKALRDLRDENKNLREKLASYQKKETAQELVEAMGRKGLLDPDTSTTEKVAALLSSGKDLGVVREALDLEFGGLGFTVDGGADPEVPSDVSGLEAYLVRKL
jgi:hypothetical protein